MSAEIPMNNPEKKELLDDNALKFTLDGIDPAFLQNNKARSFLLTTDWLEMDKTIEKKLARKEYENGDIEMLLIQKFRNNGKTVVPPKEKLTIEQYEELLGLSVRHVEKVRHEFDYDKDGISFSMKYDEFVRSKLRVLEVDAQTETERDTFNPNQFPYVLENVTGKQEYYGYQVAELL